MIYIVTGLGRCGTSMMMNCLIAGGMDAEYDECVPHIYYEKKDGYIPNPHGYRQLDAKDVKRPDFPECFDGKLIKVPCYWWTGSRGYGGREIKVPYKTIFMRRNFMEQVLSRKRFNEHLGKPKRIKSDIALVNKRKLMTLEISSRLKREAETYDEVWYPTAVFNPLPVFEMLQDHGWPINPEKSALVPDSKRYRFREK